MIFRLPLIGADLEGRLGALDALRQRLHVEAGRPSRWIGTLRREARADAAASSTAIEGFDVEPGEALAIVEGSQPPGQQDDQRMAVADYARAMDHVAAMAGDPQFRWLDRVFLDLHFDACHFQADVGAGQWRTGPMAVTAEGGELAYVAPDAADVPALMGEVAEWLEGGDPEAHSVVRAAMAHLHVMSVHPFDDGNGRVARIVQSLVLARDGLVAPELGSIETYLAEHTAEYYAALGEVQGGSYQPDRDASSWLDFCVRAHHAQALRRLEQIDAAGRRWEALERLVEGRGWPDRLVIALEQSLIGGTHRARYSAEAEVSAATASNDLRRLQDAGLLAPEGRGRAVKYRASAELGGQAGQKA